MQSLTFILPSVMVPVLSRHSTFTRASISNEYRSCTRVLCVIKRRMPTVSAKLVKSNMPEGIMPMMTVTVRWMTSLSSALPKTPSSAVMFPLLMKNMPVAMGMIKIPMTEMIHLVERMSSEFGFLYFLAFADSELR